MELAIINGTYRDTTAKQVAGGLSMYLNYNFFFAFLHFEFLMFSFKIQNIRLSKFKDKIVTI